MHIHYSEKSALGTAWSVNWGNYFECLKKNQSVGLEELSKVGAEQTDDPQIFRLVDVPEKWLTMYVEKGRKKFRRNK